MVFHELVELLLHIGHEVELDDLGSDGSRGHVDARQVVEEDPPCL
jgi:hypothetical protein